MAADRSDLPDDGRIESRTENRKPKRAIVLSGGGARGAYEAGVLRFILDELPKRTGVRPDFDIICGTSVGAIHACFLAATADETETRGERLTTIWQNLKVHEVFRFTARDFLRLPKRMLGVKRVAQAPARRPAPRSPLRSAQHRAPRAPRAAIDSLARHPAKRPQRPGRHRLHRRDPGRDRPRRRLLRFPPPRAPALGERRQCAHAADPAVAAARAGVGGDPAAVSLRAGRSALLRGRGAAPQHAAGSRRAPRRRPRARDRPDPSDGRIRLRDDRPGAHRRVRQPDVPVRQGAERVAALPDRDRHRASAFRERHHPGGPRRLRTGFPRAHQPAARAQGHRLRSRSSAIW